MTSGVRIVVEVAGGCTAGPMLIEGNETYMLTSGHCFDGGNTESKAGGSPIKEKVTSQYTTGPELEIGREGTWYLTPDRDMAAVKIDRSLGNFTEPLPDPVPALMAEWEKSPKTPHVVSGIKEAEVSVPQQVVCHEGQRIGEKCGEVLELNVTLEELEPPVTVSHHLVRTSACAKKGDSGGPDFFRVPATGEILMMGVETASNQCSTPFKSYFEPLLDTEGSPGFGVLSTFTGKSLLTTSNETREAEATLLAEWLANASTIMATLAIEITSETLFEDSKTIAGKAAVSCSYTFDGTVGPNGEGLIEKILNLAKEEIGLLGGLALLGTGAGSDCVAVAGCAEGSAASPIEVWGKGLPWFMLLHLMESGAFAELIEGEAYELLCLVIGINVEDTCESTGSEFTVLNDPVLGATMPARQARLPLAKCTQGGSESGVFETDSSAAIILTSGELLTVSSE